MPVLDTIVLFGAADPRVAHHKKAIDYLARLTEPGYYIAGLAMFEFDVVMKSRSLSFRERMLRQCVAGP